MAKKVLPHHAADIEAIVTEYLQKWEETSNNDTALITDEKWGEASSDDTALTDTELDASENENNIIIQDNQSPVLTIETSPQSLDETTGTPTLK